MGMNFYKRQSSWKVCTRCPAIYLTLLTMNTAKFIMNFASWFSSCPFLVTKPCLKKHFTHCKGILASSKILQGFPNVPCFPLEFFLKSSGGKSVCFFPLIFLSSFLVPSKLCLMHRTTVKLGETEIVILKIVSVQLLFAINQLSHEALCFPSP